MIVGRLAPRGCRRFLQHHGSRITRTRCLSTDIQANEAALEERLHAAAAAANTNIPSPESSLAHAQPTPPRRRRRRKDENRAPPRDQIVEDYLAYQHMQRTTGHLGSQHDPGYQPSSLLRNPPSPSDISLELLLASQTHLGHSTSLWNPANSRYIFGVREGIHIISLDTTAQYLRRAAKVVQGVAERGGLILFVGTRPGFDRIVVRAAQLASPACHLFERWTPGSITNGQQILGRCGVRVIDEFDAEVEGFEDQLYGRNALKPDLVVCLNPIENYVMLHECALATIPTIGIIDTDADPTWVTYPIPANDDSLRSVQVICGVLGRAGETGQKKRRDAAIAGRISYRAPDQLALPEDFDIPAFKAGKDTRKAALKSGLADMALLTDPSLGSGLAKLSETEKDTIMGGDIDALRATQERLSPQERATLIRHFKNQKMVTKAVEEERVKEEERKATAEKQNQRQAQSRGGSAKERAKAAALRAASGLPAQDETNEDQDVDEVVDQYDEGESGGLQAAQAAQDGEEDAKEDLEDPTSPLEASRRAAAEAYFNQTGTSTSTSTPTSTPESDPESTTDTSEVALIATLQRKLDTEEMTALQSNPAAFDLESVRDRLSAAEYRQLSTALQEIVEGAEEGVGDVRAESDAVGDDGRGSASAVFDPEMGADEGRREVEFGTEAEREDEARDDEEGRMGVNAREEEVMTEIDQERAGLGNADEGSLEESGRGKGR